MGWSIQRRLILSVVIVASLGACSGSTPARPTDCSQKTVSPTTLSFNAADGSASVSVSAPAGCSWTASPSTPWAAVSSGATGTGPGTVVFAVTGNAGGSRTGTATVAERTVTLTQAGAPAGCSYQVTPSGFSITSAGGVFVVQVATGAGCPWSYGSDVNWMTVGPQSAGMVSSPIGGIHRTSGSQWLEVSVQANAASSVRQGTISIAGETLTVLQDGTAAAACTYGLSPVSASFNPAGGTGTVTVVTGANCSWSIDRAFDAEDWIPALFSGRKVGSATVSYTVRPNTAFQPRSGRLLLYGTQSQVLATLVVNQGAPTCLYAVAPTQATASAAGFTGSFVVSTQPDGCSWTAAPDAAWLSVTSGSSGSGTRTVSYRANPNTGAPRSATIVVSGLTVAYNPTALFTLTQNVAAAKEP